MRSSDSIPSERCTNMRRQRASAVAAIMGDLSNAQPQLSTHANIERIRTVFCLSTIVSTRLSSFSTRAVITESATVSAAASRLSRARRGHLK